MLVTRAARVIVLGAVLATIVFCVSECSRVAVAADATSMSAERWSNLFGGEVVNLRFPMPAAPNDQVVGWNATIEKAVIVRRETALKDDPDIGRMLNVQFQLPEGEPKTILPVSIFIAQQGGEVLAKRMWIFPRNP